MSDAPSAFPLAWPTAKAHPDVSGTHAAAAEINAARDEMLRSAACP